VSPNIKKTAFMGHNHNQYMKIYHGSNIGELDILLPRQADHGKPYIYFSTNIVVATLYTVNAVSGSGLYWFPYGFDKDGRVEYTEVYPDALRDVYGDKKGFVYECDVNEKTLENPTHIPCARLSSLPVKVSKIHNINNVYERLLKYKNEDKFSLEEFETLSDKKLQFWYKMMIDDFPRDKISPESDCIYAGFFKTRMPKMWAQFEKSIHEK